MGTEPPLQYHERHTIAFSERNKLAFIGQSNIPMMQYNTYKISEDLSKEYQCIESTYFA
jgi:hypothetical protein